MQTIPVKLFGNMETSLVDYLNNPNGATDKALLDAETACNWPYAGSHEQIEWITNIHNRFRAHFEEVVTAMHAEALHERC